VVAVVERGTGERCAGGEGEGCSEEQDKKETQEMASTGWVRGGIGCGSCRGRDWGRWRDWERSWHSFSFYLISMAADAIRTQREEQFRWAKPREVRCGPEG
jgi:hypothetical protein